MITHVPKRNGTNSVVSMLQLPFCIVLYCIVPDIVWTIVKPEEKKKIKLYYREIGLFILHTQSLDYLLSLCLKFLKSRPLL